MEGGSRRGNLVVMSLWSLGGLGLGETGALEGAGAGRGGNWLRFGQDPSGCSAESRPRGSGQSCSGGSCRSPGVRCCTARCGDRQRPDLCTVAVSGCGSESKAGVREAPRFLDCTGSTGFIGGREGVAF